MQTQNDRLLSWLKLRPINPMLALGEIGIFRLAARIKDLRNMGYNIIKRTVNVLNKYGETCRVAEYWLVD